MPAVRERLSRRTSHRRPSTPRTLVVLAVAAAMTSLPVLPSVTADELDKRKQRVERQIEETEDHLHHSSEELAASVRRLDRAVSALHDAQAELTVARGELLAAEALDREMQAALAEAVDQLSRARAELAEGKAGLSRSEEELRGLAVQMQAAGGSDLMALSAVLHSQRPAQLTGRLGSRQSVLDKETAALARLEASQVMLTVQEASLEEAKEEVAVRRAAAAENLERKTQLEAEAAAAEGRVRELVGARRQARQEAAAAKAEDLRRLRQFERERNHVAELLRRRAERARARALAAARARAAAAARAAARSGSAAPPRSSSQGAVAGGILGYPVSGYITSSYGMRLHPIYKRWTLHDGTDFGAGCGAPIRASASGTVVGRYYDSGYGNRVIIDHGWVGGAGLGTSYNHLSSYSTYTGERVQRGEIIGYVGNTGYSTGCHLHFMVFRNGATVDPMNWL